MKKDIIYQSQRKSSSRAQAMVEFAIALPVLLVLLVGIMEVGRMIFIYSAVINASREAARYGSAVGWDTSGTYHRYKYCAGIANMAKSTAFLIALTNANIDIRYDSGPSDATYADGHGPDNATEFNLLTRTCPPATTGEATVTVASKDRIVIKITAAYTPVIKLIPIPTRNFVSISSRSILGTVSVNP